MNYKASIISFFFLIFSVSHLKAQTDSSLKLGSSPKKWHIKNWTLPHVTFPHVALPEFHFPKLKLTSELKKKDFFVNAGINFSKQTINGMDNSLPFNYDVSKMNTDVYKPGYFIGARWERVFKGKHLYNIEMGLNKISSGTKYTMVTNLDPFIGEFVQHKADAQFFILNIGANYKKLLPIKNMDKFKLYVLAGPSLDFRLSNQSIHNKVTNSYKKILLRANFGVELDNNGYYTVFMHYKPSVSSFTKQPIHTTMNSFELGMMMNVNDIF